MADDDEPTRRWSEEPGDRLTGMLAAITGTLHDHERDGEDLHGIFVLHDGHGHSGAASMGYERNPGHQMVADFIKFTGMLFAASGIKMDAVFLKPGEPPPEGAGAEHYESPLAESDPGKPRAVLTVEKTWPDERIPKITEIIKTALESGMELEDTKVLILMQVAGGQLAVMQHGFEEPADLAHALLGCLMQLAGEDSHVMIIPVFGNPN
jgi:hypothetical protein